MHYLSVPAQYMQSNSSFTIKNSNGIYGIYLGWDNLKGK